VNGFLLDTNVLSEFSRTGDPNQRVKDWIRNAPQEALFVSVLTFAEIRRGIALLPSGKRRTQLEEWLEHDLLESFGARLLPVTRLIADRWAALSAQAQLRGKPLAVADGLIAATALEHDLTLVTRNAKDFAGTGAVVFNPWEG
jgi:predicted nucleic acid-binding protein